MELGMVVLPWLCPLLCPVCVLRHMLVTLPIILRGLASIHPRAAGTPAGRGRGPCAAAAPRPAGLQPSTPCFTHISVRKGNQNDGKKSSIEDMDHLVISMHG